MSVLTNPLAQLYPWLSMGAVPGGNGIDPDQFQNAIVGQDGQLAPSMDVSRTAPPPDGPARLPQYPMPQQPVRGWMSSEGGEARFRKPRPAAMPGGQMSVPNAAPRSMTSADASAILDAAAEKRAAPLRAQNDATAQRLVGKEQLLSDITDQSRKTMTGNVRSYAAMAGLDPLELAKLAGGEGDMMSRGALDEGRLAEKLKAQRLERSLTSHPQEQRFRKLLAAAGSKDGQANIPDPAPDAAAIMADVKSGKATLNSGSMDAWFAKPSQGSKDAVAKIKAGRLANQQARQAAAPGGAGMGIGPNVAQLNLLYQQGQFRGIDPQITAGLFQHAQTQDTALQQSQMTTATQGRELDLKSRDLAQRGELGKAEIEMKNKAIDQGKGQDALAGYAMDKSEVDAGKANSIEQATSQRRKAMGLSSGEPPQPKLGDPVSGSSITGAGPVAPNAMATVKALASRKGPSGEPLGVTPEQLVGALGGMNLSPQDVAAVQGEMARLGITPAMLQAHRGTLDPPIFDYRNKEIGMKPLPFVGKKSDVVSPLGSLFRWLGGGIEEQSVADRRARERAIVDALLNGRR